MAVVSAVLLAGWLYYYGMSLDKLSGVSLGWVAVGTAVVLAVVCALSRRFTVVIGRGNVELFDVAILTALVLMGPVWARGISGAHFGPGLAPVWE